MICFYHNDLDGRAAAAIVRFKHPTRLFIELNYKDEVPIHKIQANELVFIVDFSFKPEVMAKVLTITQNVVWLDHHKTAFEYDYGEVLVGIRDEAFSGCELTWIYLFPSEPVPRWVMLIGDRDKWAWKFGILTTHFCLGMQAQPHQPGDPIWEQLLKYPALEAIIHDGKIIQQFKDQFCKSYADGYGFETTFDGIRCYAMNLYQLGSEAFGYKMDTYDVCIAFVFDGKNYTVSLYSTKITVDDIAKAHGGGGHPNAAGFVCDTLPFCKNR